MLQLVWGCLLFWGAFFESLGERGRFVTLLQARFRGKGPTSNMGKKEASGLAPLILAFDPLDILPWLAGSVRRETSYIAAVWLEALTREVAIQLGFWACTILAFPPLLGRGRAPPNTAVAQ